MKTTMNHPVVKLFTELLAAPAPSNREEKIRDIIVGRIKKLGFKPEIDPSGNVIARLSGKSVKAPPIMFAAHMDEIAMVVTAVEENGDLRVGPSGGLRPWKLGETPVEIVGDHDSATGVFSFGSVHRKDADDMKITWSDAKIITGLSPSTLRKLGIRPGSCAVPVRETRGPVLFGDPKDPLIGAWTFDDRMGCVTLLRLLEEVKKNKIMPARQTLICFTIHEEGGCHGAKNLANRERPEIFVAIDGCPIVDEKVLRLDRRPGVWSMDRIGHYDQRLVVDFMRAAVKAGTELQPVVYDSAASDASAVFAAGAAPRVAFVGHVRTNSHGFEVARLSCFDNLLRTLVEYLRD